LHDEVGKLYPKFVELIDKAKNEEDENQKQINKLKEIFREAALKIKEKFAPEKVGRLFSETDKHNAIVALDVIDVEFLKRMIELNKEFNFNNEEEKEHKENIEFLQKELNKAADFIWAAVSLSNLDNFLGAYEVSDSFKADYKKEITDKIDKKEFGEIQKIEEK